MSYAKEREDFLLTMQAEGMHPEIARRIIRHANTIQRLAALACSSEAADRDQARCPYKPGDTGRCLCRAQRLIEELCKTATCFQSTCECVDPPHGPNEPCCRQCYPYCCHWRRFAPIFDGDPRGACVKLKVPSGRTDDGGRTGICVPTRRY